MNKTIISESLWPHTGDVVNVTASKECVVVDILDSGGIVPWDKIDDVEWLAARCREMLVYQLEAICKALARCVPLRDYYLSLPGEAE